MQTFSGGERVMLQLALRLPTSNPTTPPADELRRHRDSVLWLDSFSWKLTVLFV
ncbi:MAG: hypothetical protein V8Q79_08695 [Christensenellales bacterium]